jgi:transposase
MTKLKTATLGIDVSKEKLDAALWLEGARKWYALKATNDKVGAAKLLEWASSKSGLVAAELRVLMEATGVYHEVVAQAFHDHGCEVVIANPKRVRDYAKGKGFLTKTDGVDARVLARYGAQGDELMAWAPPPPAVRVLRALVARLDAVNQDLQREENRLEKAQATSTPAVVRDSLDRSLVALRAERQRLLQSIEDHFDDHPDLKQERDRLKTIPGVGDASANRMLCLLKRHRFESARQAAACAGLIPIEYESGSSVRKPPRLSKQGDPRLRATLYMAAVSAARYNPLLRKVYLDLINRGKPKMSALGAVMRRLIHIAFGILKHQTDFNPAISAKNA